MHAWSEIFYEEEKFVNESHPGDNFMEVFVDEMMQRCCEEILQKFHFNLNRMKRSIAWIHFSKDMPSFAYIEARGMTISVECFSFSLLILLTINEMLKCRRNVEA